MPRMRHTYVNAWSGVPTSDAGGDTAAVTLGLRIRADVSGRVMGVRFFRDLGDDAEHVGLLWQDSDMKLLDACVFHRVAASGSGQDGWHSAYFRKPQRVTAGGRFVIGVHFAAGRYWVTPLALESAEVVNGNLAIVRDGDGGSNGMFSYGTLHPNNAFRSTAYGVDVIFLEDV